MVLVSLAEQPLLEQVLFWVPSVVQVAALVVDQEP